jgi:MFS family permease
MRPAGRVRPLVAIARSRAPTLLAAGAFEVGSVLLPALVVVTLAASPAALGVVEGVAIGVGAAGQLLGGVFAHHRARRRVADIGGYAGVAACTAAMAAASATGQAGVLRAGAWLCWGIRLPGSWLTVSEAAAERELGREYGLERAAEYLGAGAGAALAVLLVATLSVRAAIALAVVPGLAAVIATVVTGPEADPTGTRVLPGLAAALRGLRSGPVAGTLVGIGVLEAANISFTLLILRAIKLLEARLAVDTAVVVAVALFVGYRIAAMASGIIGGRVIDAYGVRRPLGAGALCLLVAYVLFAETAGGIAVLAGAFALAGAGIGMVETGEHVAVARRAPPHSRALAFGALTALQSAGRLFASIAAGVLWTLVAPAAGLLVTVPLLVLAPVLLLIADRRLPAA